MTKLVSTFLLLILLSCTNVNKEKKKLALNAWKGRPALELLNHSYFRTLKISKVKHGGTSEAWVFRDQAKFQTSAYCQGLGGCIGMPTYNCDTAFSIQNNVILGVEQNGECPGAKTIAPKAK